MGFIFIFQSDQRLLKRLDVQDQNQAGMNELPGIVKLLIRVDDPEVRRSFPIKGGAVN